jgi:hypothetical protein
MPSRKNFTSILHAETASTPFRRWKFSTPTGKAMITVNELEYIECPTGRLLLQSMRAHDQFNTTIYNLDDR